MTKRAFMAENRRPLASTGETSQTDLFVGAPKSSVPLQMIDVGDGSYVTADEYLEMLAFLTFETSIAGAKTRGIARNALEAILHAAAAGGFTNGDLLETLMAACEKSPRVTALLCQAVAAVGSTAAFIEVLQRAGLPTGNTQ